MRPLAILALLMLLAAPASAQVPKFWHIGVGGGVTVPVGNIKDTLKQGYTFQAVGSLNLPGMPVGLRASFNYQKFNQKVDQSVDTGNEATGTIMSGLGNAQFSLIKVGPIRPYVAAGLGAFRVGSETTLDGNSETDSSMHFGINGAAGAEFTFGSVLGYVEARLENIYTEKGFSDQVTDRSTIQFVPVVFGLMF
jgi:opacity protein-like surface antigen